MINDTALSCLGEKRRDRVREEGLNGIDYVEVSDDQRSLTIYFLGKAPQDIRKENVAISGGRRITGIRVVDLRLCILQDEDRDDCMKVVVDRPGDFSTYRLCLVETDEQGCPTGKPLHGFDPRYSCVEFSFKIGCPSDLDCRTDLPCPPPEYDEPEIDYLAKDYAGFRQLMLDRLALVMPEWKERHVPDLGITLVELLAYVGDHLSYYQDAVATEAYLETARQRISVRRHARLVDYRLHEGCNARAWVSLETSSDLDLDSRELYFVTAGSGGEIPAGAILTDADLENVPADHYEVFEPLMEHPGDPVRLRSAHNAIPFYTWGESECCIRRGATSATLKDAWVTEGEEGSGDGIPVLEREVAGDERPRALDLRAGDLLIFEEVIGPKTGVPGDADRTHRQAVRLIRVEPIVDELYDQPVVEIEWDDADALAFTLCISAIGPAEECVLIEGISVARGNVVLADHGRTLPPEDLGSVPLDQTSIRCEGVGEPSETSLLAGPFRPVLAHAPLTFSQPLRAGAPASAMLTQDPASALPAIDLRSIAGSPDGAGPIFHRSDIHDPEQLAGRLRDPGNPADAALLGLLSAGTRALLDGYDGSSPLPDGLHTALGSELLGMLTGWAPRYDLLESGMDDRDFVVEIDNQGLAHLRFGNGEMGEMPEAGMSFDAAYRVGSGPAGNVGAEAISRLALRTTKLDGVTITPRNPLPARGGIVQESLAEARLRAPHAFRSELRRAITADDYALLSMGGEGIQRTAGSLRWMGSWYEVQVAVDPKGSDEQAPALIDDVTGRLYRYGRMGYDLKVLQGRYVPLAVELAVCVEPHYLRSHVKAALLELFSNRRRGDGSPGFFHPDNLSFGDGIYLSRIVAAAQGVTGVESVQVTKLERLFEGSNHEIERGVLALGPLEIARLDNDPGNPENGQLTLNMRGGR